MLDNNLIFSLITSLISTFLFYLFANKSSRNGNEDKKNDLIENIMNYIKEEYDNTHTKRDEESLNQPSLAKAATAVKILTKNFKYKSPMSTKKGRKDLLKKNILTTKVLDSIYKTIGNQK